MYYPRETERDYLFTRATLIFCIMLPLLMMMGLSQQHGVLYTRIKISPRVAQGTVSQVVEVPTWRRSVEVSYYFQPDNGPAQTGLYIEDVDAAASNYKVGQTIGVTYSGWSPHISTPTATLERNTADFYMFNSCFGLMVLCISLLVWTIHSIITHREQDRTY